MVGLRALAVTDHDTMAGVPEAATVAADHGIDFVPGVEITARIDRGNVHVLAYFVDPQPPTLLSFLEVQRAERVERARRIAERLQTTGAPVDVETLIDRAESDRRSITRPLLAQALVEAGHARSLREAFDRWLANGRPAYVPCSGKTPLEVVRFVARAGGISALAHPGLLKRDDLIAPLARAGLTALEAFHPDHDAATRARYLRIAERCGLAVSGGSDYHGGDHRRASSFGVVGVPPEWFLVLRERLVQAHRVRPTEAGHEAEDRGPATPGRSVDIMNP